MNTLTMTTTARRSTTVTTALQRVVQTLWRGLEAHGQDRARRHLLDYARQCESIQPEMATELRAASRAVG